jgi:hypothetical protein
MTARFGGHYGTPCVLTMTAVSATPQEHDGGVKLWVEAKSLTECREVGL